MDSAPDLRSHAEGFLRKCTKLMDFVEDGMWREVWVMPAEELGTGSQAAMVGAPPIPAGQEFLTVQEVADSLRVDHKVVRRQIQRGDLKAVRQGRLLRIPAAELERLRRGMDLGPAGPRKVV